MENDSGINSLAGFSYQMKVFILKSATLNENEKIEFETIDDIAFKKVKDNDLDNQDALLHQENKSIAVQVKKTNVTLSVLEKVLYNWLLLKDKKIDGYYLVTDYDYGNQDMMSTISFEDLYNKLKESNMKKNALISKIKNNYKNDKNLFLEDCNNIKNKYHFENIKDIDKEIYIKYKTIFRKAAIIDKTYERRICRFLEIVTYEILEQISLKKPYILDYDSFIKIIEKVSEDITDEHFTPDYALFKKNNSEFNKLMISNSREYFQLKSCKLPKDLIIDNLCREMFYKDFKYRNLESGKYLIINNIEETSYFNFRMIKTKLQIDQNDKPENRFFKFYEQGNSYADSAELKMGSGVYLTREEEVEKQISWEDESNEQK